MKNLTATLIFVFTLVSLSTSAIAKKKKDNNEKDTIKGPLTEQTFAALKLRNIGPAFMSGRIADIAIHPEDDNTWYIAVGSGGVWKTTNAGITWKSIFDGQGSYSIGCVTIDESNPNVIWVGTGENVGGRHVGYGDGIYKSSDGGKKWKNMGLKKSEHISKIIIHPENSDVLWVAAQGPLWAAGGERGIYKTEDGGKTWKKQLGDEEYTGATDLVIDPRDPDVLYAATWQHHRTVATYMGGGPKTALYRTDDGGENWSKLEQGLPKGNKGKIGLAISPQNPDVVYAAIELDRRKGGLYRSADRGASWVKMSDAVSGGTGPHYYQELVASPFAFDRLYLCDVRIQISDDGGKTFRRMEEKFKHSDNHAIAFRKDDPDYLLIGTDGGLYESFDLAKTWRYMENLPLTQFYKVAVDDKDPFYTVYGGTQDNCTQGGPSRTDNVSGIRNSDWEIVLFADGHQPATEPGNPDIMYAQWQEGNLVRIDRTTGEIMYIQPQPDKDFPAHRYNWDAPILVSPHNPTTIFHASQVVWKSNDRGDSWTAISGDLTRNEERITIPIMGRRQSFDAPWDMYAMSTYNTITSLSESPQKEGLIYAGTDDGLIQLTEDGGTSWRKIEVGSIPGVPATAFVNDIKADLFDENTVYVALDNHKFGDFKPYLVKSADKGNTWTSIGANIPDRTLVWRLVQDHIDPDLLFAATEFGIYFTIDGGEKWIKITGGAPTISFRDLAIQRRENDLIGASFGRGFFILDDYSSLREVSPVQLEEEATLFPVRDAWWYAEKDPMGGKKGYAGEELFVAENPPFGAVFTIYLKEGIKTLEEKRKEKEKELNKGNMDVPFPGWDELDKEKNQKKPALWLTVTDSDGNVVRKIKARPQKGFQRVAWDLRYSSTRAAREKSSPQSSGDMLVVPGRFTVSLSKEVDGVITNLSESQDFVVKPLRKGALDGSSYELTMDFYRELNQLSRSVEALTILLGEAGKTVAKMENSLLNSTIGQEDMYEKVHDLSMQLKQIGTKLSGSSSKNEIGEKKPHTIRMRISAASMGGTSSYGPTPNSRKTLGIAKEEFAEIKTETEQIINEDIPELLKALHEAGAPWVEGMPLPGGE